MTTYEIKQAGNRWQLLRTRPSGVRHIVPGCSNLRSYDEAWQIMMDQQATEDAVKWVLGMKG